MKIFSLVIIISVLSSCTTKPFINSKLRADRIGDDCSQGIGKIGMTQNIDGEHYIFNYCLTEGFDEKNYSISRQADTIILSLPAPSASEKTALYKVALDIDASPQYKFIKIGNQLLGIGLSAN